jgi:hypothetical protein
MDGWMRLKFELENHHFIVHFAVTAIITATITATTMPSGNPSEYELLERLQAFFEDNGAL